MISLYIYANYKENFNRCTSAKTWDNYINCTRNCLFACLGFNGTVSTNRLYCATEVGKYIA